MLDLRAGAARIDLDVLVVDNASPRPLDMTVAGRARLLRLADNTGGSGGFNAGLSWHLRHWPGPAAPNHFLWLLDSDARLRADTLVRLLEEMDRSPRCVVAGSALADPVTGVVFETGGFVDRRTGELVQPAPLSEPAPVQYVAACSMLVRRWAVEHAGLMRDVFLNGDDAEWCIRLARATAGDVVAVPASVALHPRPDRMRTTARYYAARNAYVPLAAAGAGPRARFVRALRETARAVSQHMIGRDDLARLHIRGLRDAAAGCTLGAAPVPIHTAPPQPLGELAPAFSRLVPRGASVGVSAGLVVPACLAAVAALPGSPAFHSARTEPRPTVTRHLLAALRFLTGPRNDVAFVSARARPGDWFAGRTVFILDEPGFHVRRVSRPRIALAAAATLLRGSVLAVRLAIRPPRHGPAPRAPVPARPAEPDAPRLCIAVLSFNRAAALQRTLEALARLPDTRDADIIVADNASTDGSPDMVRRLFPAVRVIELKENAGVAGFNRAVELARSPYVLVLDDDAQPGDGAVAAALAKLDHDPTLGAVVLHPRHPATGAGEWAFADSARARRIRDRRWPAMGCGNLVRRDAWALVGGYDESFFLYRNDCDLAMKLLGAGYAVAFDPALVVWHDSPATSRKSARWFELATRNWIVMCRRHGRGITGPLATLSGWAWAHRLAGLNPRMHAKVLRGALAGIVAPRARAALGAAGAPDGAALDNLFRLQLGAFFGRTRSPTRTSPAAAVPAGAPNPASTSTDSSERHSA